MRKWHLLVWVLAYVFSPPLFAQSNDIPENIDKPFSGFIDFRQTGMPAFDLWQSVLRKSSGTGLEMTWKIYSELADELGQIHYRAQQYFNGVAVEYGVVVIHTEGNRILSFNGEIIPEKMLNSGSQIDVEAARNIALNSVSADQYYWEDPAQNAILQNLTGVVDTTYFPAGRMVYCPENLNYLNPHQLAYCFEVYALTPLVGKRIYVSAQGGQIIATEELICHTDVTGKAITKFSGTRAITTDSTAPGNYRLREKKRGKGIETYNMKTGTSYGAAVDFTDADNAWNNVNAAKDEVATDAHWGAEKTYDYYDSVLNRKSFDNNDAKIISYVHYSSNYSNAFWNGSYMTYGDGNGSTWLPLTSIDVCGHEISHAVTTYTAGLVYSYESGALNESFSDIFGNAIERWARPNKFDWKMGEDFTTNGNGIRDMSNPIPYNNPKYYKGNKWYAGAGDNGGVHTNSGVQNYWFYLIVDGVAGTNEKGDVFDIDSLGVYDASHITYRNLSVYLTKNSQYTDARAYSILAATDLFGNCSKQVIAVTNAWWACGVGAKYDSGFVKADFIADTVVCSTLKAVKFNNLSTNSLNCKWYFGDGNTSTVFSPTYNYSSFGTFDIKLVANSCFQNKSDSITKKAYVKVDSTFDICNAVLMPVAGTDSVVKCYGFIYDDGGEGNYGALRQTNLKVKIPGATSIKFRFLVLGYENGYDSIVLFKNNTSQANKIGRFTGSTIPFGGTWQTVTADALWLRHYSDPLVEGKGFKIEFEGIRNPITVDLGNDTTICFGDSVTLSPKPSGGYAPDYRYIWSNGSNGLNIKVAPTGQTRYYVTLRDVCTALTAKDSVLVSVRLPLNVTLGRDTIICNGNGVTLSAKPSGGLSTAYSYKWSNIGSNVASQLVKPTSTTTYNVILSDGCTNVGDTAYQTVFVKPALAASVVASDTLVCIGKSITLTAKGAGGDTAGYVFSWDKGLGVGASKTFTISDTVKYTVTLTDGCSVAAAQKSIDLFTYPELNLSISADTLICRGSGIDLLSNLSGGKGTGYTYSWSNGKTVASITENPSTAQFYKVTGKDGCSPDKTDSVYVDLLAPLSLSKVSDTVLCDGQTLNLNLLHTGGLNSAHNIAWTPGTVSGFSVGLSPSTGVTNYAAILTDGCTVKNDTVQFKINKLAPLSANINITPSAICLGDSIQMKFTIGGGKAASRQWTLDGVPVSFISQTLKPIVNSNYKLDLTDGCSVPASSTASVNISAAAAANLSVLPKLACVGSPVTLKYTSPDAANVMWYFSNGDSANGTGIDYTRSFTTAGKYNAKAKITTSNGCKGEFLLSDTIQSVTYPKASFTALPDVTNIENPDITFSNSSSKADIYFWSFGDGSISTTGTDQFHTYNDTGWFRVNLKISSNPGCADSTFRMVRIKDVYRLYMPGAFSPDANNLNDLYLPAGRGINTFHMTIYNRWGEKVFESYDKNKGWNGLTEKGSPWPPGMYPVLIEIIDSEDFRHVEKGTVMILK